MKKPAYHGGLLLCYNITSAIYAKSLFSEIRTVPGLSARLRRYVCLPILAAHIPRRPFGYSEAPHEFGTKRAGHLAKLHLCFFASSFAKQRAFAVWPAAAMQPGTFC